jgi:Tfp pilus assembly protein PilO
VYCGVILSPLWSLAMRTGQELRQAEQALRDIEQGLLQQPQLQQQQKDLEARAAQLRTVVPMEDQLPSVLQHLTEVAAQTGINVEAITPKPNASKELPVFYRQVPIELKGLAGYHQLGVFLSRVETEGPPIRIQTLRISANRKVLRRHDVQLVLQASLALLAPSEEPVPSDPPKRKGGSRSTIKPKGKKR